MWSAEAPGRARADAVMDPVGRRVFGRAVLLGLLGIDVAGAFLATVLVLGVMPSELADPRARLTSLALAGGYTVVATYVGFRLGRRLLAPVADWWSTDLPASPELQQRVLDVPRRLLQQTGLLWVVGVIGAVAYALTQGFLYALSLGLGFATAGLFAGSLSYLVAERVLRPVAARALLHSPPRRPVSNTVARRIVLAWLMSSGSGLLTVVLASGVALMEPRATGVVRLAVTILVLVAIFGLGGLLATTLAARATADPISELTQAVEAVQHGHLDQSVTVWDGSELGVLQAGFNSMVTGLAERERIRDLFGRQVGEDVARTALRSGVRFEGEVRDACVLFVDLVGSTTLAQERPATEVVRMLNAFFQIVIEVVHDHGGWINKFLGDAALAVWGTPLAVEDPATLSLQAARRLAERIARELPELQIGVGLSVGPVVAGNVGAEERYEYTVIGDPVNEASRLSDLAKSAPRCVVVNAALIEAATAAERAHWVEGEPVTVRGRLAPTRVAAWDGTSDGLAAGQHA